MSHESTLNTVLGLCLAALLAACATAAGGEVDASTIDVPDAAPSTIDARTNGPPDADLSPDANNCVTQPCDLYEQCGCTPPQVCDLDDENLATGGTACRDVSTPGTDIDTCSAADGCAGGYVCLGNPGQCRRYCEDDDDCPGEGGLCMLNIVFGTPSQDVPGAVTCTKDCEPTVTAPASCPTGFACHLYYDDPNETVNGDERFLTDCTKQPATGGGDGEACTYNSDCVAGFDCINVDSVAQCKQTCACPSVGNCTGGSCDTGSCMGFSDPRPILGGTEYGVCI